MLYFFNSSLSAGQIFALILAFVLAICIGMTAHEYAHARTALKRGDDTAKLSGRLTLNPLAHISGFGLMCFVLFGFGWAKPVPINPTKFRNYKKDATWVLLSGVLTNLVLALVFSGLYAFLGGPLMAASDNLLMFFLLCFLQYGFLLNLALAIFNLLPIPPLDGFGIIEVWSKYGNKFVRFMQQYGIIFLIIFILPLFNGQSLLSLFYNTFEYLFLLFWGLFV